jgi:mannose-1-phosphate guanylyltransferase/mannose-1-phosphate guanylyltransferase/mannose-6-phosphate isomerase
MAEQRIVPIILSGGSGTRLWPLSRLGRPKQLIALSGEETLLQGTARRLAGDGFAPPIVVAGADQADAIEEQLGDVRLILEPAARNTAPAIALAAIEAGPHALLLVAPSDHHIEDEEAFRAAIAAGARHAREGWIVTFGVAPDRPETGYGYIERAQSLGGGAHQVARFTEKPDRETAARFLEGGRHDWNAGLFLMRADTFLEQLSKLAPDMLAAAQAAMASAERKGRRVLPDAGAFAASPSGSIDRVVAERAPRVAVVPVTMGWSDVGSWAALHAIGDRDERGNVLSGDVVAPDSRNCLVRSDGPVVVALGVEDLVIVATERAVLVVPRSESQRVAEAIEALKDRAER